MSSTIYHSKNQSKPGNLMSIVHTELVTIGAEDPVEEAYEMMVQKKLRHLPVVDRDDQVVGIISSHDIERAKWPYPNSQGRFIPDTGFPIHAEVRDYMTAPVISLSVLSDISWVVDLMLDKKVSSCLIEKDGEVIGIITAHDLLVLLKELLHKTNNSPTMTLEQWLSESPIGPLATMLSNSGI